MRHQAFRTIALMLGVMLAAAPAAQAGTITYGELVRTVGAGGQLRPASGVRLRLDARQGAAAAQAGPTQSGATSSEEQQAAGQLPSAPNGSTSVSLPASADPTISQSGGQVQTVDLGDVTGTVCACGEIPPTDFPPGAGFPWWTLAGIPLICVSGICAGGDDDIIPTSTPTPTPPNNPIPEPMSLFLFGSGLLAVGAGARRRRARKQLEGKTFSATTEEV